ncbi:hypothetical protein J3R30DRAFT_3724829 [Lentinula aciculospora]|uniref:F-box domain-containing protein n=1 Tax=Lentinula aciculospora TaxID=153920 RepID=A0A9W8ZRK7_9AGAR|nr:hypothetical protein J3R30DRAFT_3724829 [Lentinula aciculospora]
MKLPPIVRYTPYDVSLINRLPIELLSEIFAIHCQSHPPYIARNAPQFILARICTLWRAITYETPQVWRTLCLLLTNLDDRRIIRHWPNRAKTLLLDVGLVQLLEDGPVHQETLEYLVSLAPLCRAVDLSLFWKAWVQLPLPCVDNYPHLESASVTILGSYERNKISSNDSKSVCNRLNSLFSARNLRRTIIRSSSLKPKVRLGLRNLTLPMKRLTSLSLDLELYKADPMDGFAALNACKSLKACKIYIPFNRIPLIFVDLQIVLPHLEFLTIAFRGDYSASTFLENTLLPSLKVLDLHFSPENRGALAHITYRRCWNSLLVQIDRMDKYTKLRTLRLHGIVREAFQEHLHVLIAVENVILSHPRFPLCALLDIMSSEHDTSWISSSQLKRLEAVGAKWFKEVTRLIGDHSPNEVEGTVRKSGITKWWSNPAPVEVSILDSQVTFERVCQLIIGVACFDQSKEEREFFAEYDLGRYELFF